MEKLRKKISILMVGLVLISTSVYAEDAVTCKMEARSYGWPLRTTSWSCSDGVYYVTTSINIFGTWYVVDEDTY